MIETAKASDKATVAITAIPWEPLSVYQARMRRDRKSTREFQRANTSRGYNVPQIKVRAMRSHLPTPISTPESSCSRTQGKVSSRMEKVFYVGTTEIMTEWRFTMKIEGEPKTFKEKQD